VNPYRAAGFSLSAYRRTQGGPQHCFSSTLFSRGKRVRVCSISRSPDFSTVTTEGEVSEAQWLLKPVRDSEVDRCAGRQCVHTSGLRPLYP